MIPCAPLNPHGLDVPCNSYCWGDMHAIVVLGSLLNGDGSSTTEASMVTGMAPYYRSLGWHLLRCRRAETTTEQVFATIQAQTPGRAVRIGNASTEEEVFLSHPETLDDYEPWLMIVGPLPEEE